jgi:hypothetical protein
MDSPPVAPDVAQVLKHDRTPLRRHTAARRALAAGLFAEVHGRCAHRPAHGARAARCAWFAGDAAFGGVMIVPASNAMLFVQPAAWEKYQQERAQAGPQRGELAEQAGVWRLLELREPRGMVLG